MIYFLTVTRKYIMEKLIYEIRNVFHSHVDMFMH
jgi:hypothetical protein